ncbi:uncharacterized protein LOC125597981 [Brassica napus]|uniref:uncharacterized protein LOC125597981 n=1 Tax=Brassica napus TaxID=3708 RepID=UPI002078951B|nr:uncharacterized protein LOC125597981 [Brassica napus]
MSQESTEDQSSEGQEAEEPSHLDHEGGNGIEPDENQDVADHPDHPDQSGAEPSNEELNELPEQGGVEATEVEAPEQAPVEVYANKSNISKVYEVKGAINSLSQEDTDFDAHFGKFRSLWAELEMLRPATVDPDVLHERREQDKVFALLLTLNPGTEGRANYSGDIGETSNRSQAVEEKKQGHDDTIKKSDIEALIKALKESGNTLGTSLNATYHTPRGLFTSYQVAHQTERVKPLVIDSGASHHMISDVNLISNIEPVIGNVMIANGDKIPIKGVGTLKLFDKDSKAFYMPTFASNLLSVKRATTDLNCNVIFSPNEVVFQDIETLKLIGKGVTKGDLYLLEDAKTPSYLSSAFSSIPVLDHDTNVPKRFWSDAVMTACYLINRTPTRILGDLTPYEPDGQRNKLEPRSTKAVFLGYSTTQKGYKCYVPEARKVLVSRDVKFVESRGYFEKKSWDELKDLSQPSSDRADTLRRLMQNLGISLFPSAGTQETGAVPEIVRAPQDSTTTPHPHPDPEWGNNNDHEAESNDPNVHDPDEQMQQEADQTTDVNSGGVESSGQEDVQEVQQLRRSTRQRKPVSNWNNTRVYFNAEAIAHPPSAVPKGFYLRRYDRLDG